MFTNIWVEGEISNLARPASGHVYFTLKDSGAQVRCALFRNNAARVRQALKDGLAVKVRGKVSLFEGRGDYQLILDTVEPAGDGALRLAFDALKEKLSAEGLFSAERKVPLPAHPRAHWHYQFAHRRGDPRHHQRVPPPGAEHAS